MGASAAPGEEESVTAEHSAVEIDAMRSIEGAVFEIGDTNLYTVEKPEENFFEINKIEDQSLNQNVFGKRVLLLSSPHPPADEQKLSGGDEEHLQAVPGFGPEQILDQAGSGFESGVLHFTEDCGAEEANTVIFDNGP